MKNKDKKKIRELWKRRRRVKQDIEEGKRRWIKDVWNKGTRKTRIGHNGTGEREKEALKVRKRENREGGTRV